MLELLALLAIGAWAFLLNDHAHLDLPAITLRAPVSTVEIERGPRVNRAHFALELWESPDVVVEATSGPASSRQRLAPIRLQLIGIIEEENGSVHAALYDPEDDRILVLTGGDTIGPLELRLITADRVTFADGRVLELQSGHASSGDAS